MKAVDTRGIILAGGSGTRMYPMTQAVNKQLLPVYDKPLVYYPMATLMSAGISRVLVISQEENIPLYRSLFGDGRQWGMVISYAAQPEPKGLAQAFTIAANARFLDDARNVALILGDNIFHGYRLDELLFRVAESGKPSIFITEVTDPQRYGVAEFIDGALVNIHEKPTDPPSNMAVTGLYFYPAGEVVTVVDQLKPSVRGELEITDVNRHFIRNRTLEATTLGPGIAWLDTGTPSSLLQASHYVETIQTRQGRMVACLEEIALGNGWITVGELSRLAQRRCGSGYGEYLEKLVVQNPPDDLSNDS